jgi:uncharacterized protein (TIGR02996 family)
MTRDEAFLADICERPDVDAPRLIYADWLDENGDPDRAEFIRLQVELTATPRFADGRLIEPLRPRRRKGDTSPRPPPLRERDLRARILLRRHGKEWRAGVPRWARAPRFRRGFVGLVHAEAADWLRASHRLRKRFPIEGLHVDYLAPPHGEELLRGGSLRGLRDLAVPGLSYWPGLVELLASSSLTSLVELDLSRSVTSGAGLAGLADSPHLTGLWRLELWSNHLVAGDAPALVRWAGRAGLKHLALGDNDLGDDGVRALAGCPALSGLTHLLLDRNGIGPDGAAALAASPHLAGLVELGLIGNPLGPRGAAALASSPHLNKLRRLNVAATSLGGHEPFRALQRRFGGFVVRM